MYKAVESLCGTLEINIMFWVNYTQNKYINKAALVSLTTTCLLFLRSREASKLWYSQE